MIGGLPESATLHANSAREAVEKMCTFPLLAGPSREAGSLAEDHNDLVRYSPLRSLNGWSTG